MLFAFTVVKTHAELQICQSKMTCVAVSNKLVFLYVNIMPEATQSCDGLLDYSDWVPNRGACNWCLLVEWCDTYNDV